MMMITRSRAQMMNNLVSLPQNDGSCSFGKNGLQIRDGLSFEEWQDIGVTLDIMGRALQFAIGDWINYGEFSYGEKYAQAINLTNYQEHTLINLASVARRVPMSFRHEVLSYSHHVAVAYLEADDQIALLDEAEEFGLSVRQLRQRVKDTQNGSNVDELLTGRCCPNCGYELEG